MRVLFPFVVGLFFTLFSYGQQSDFSDSNFDRADSLAIAYRSIKGTNTDKITQLITQDLHRDEEKARAIFRWITFNISYDCVAFHKKQKPKRRHFTSKKAKLNYKNKQHNKIIKRTLRHKKAICFGYAYLYQDMCSKAGVKSEIVEGFARTTHTKIGEPRKPNHAWNALKINGKWYLTDPTWASGYTNEKVTNFQRSFDPDYFLMEPEDLINTHYSKDPAWLIVDNKPGLRTFLNSPVKLKGFSKNRINQFYPEKGLIRIKAMDTVAFGFTSNKPNGLRVIKISEKESQISTPAVPLEQDQEGFYRYDHTFNDKGQYQLQLAIDGHYSLVYHIVVR